mmetsp:Transcript_15446/g.7476  ORF Transcript_15446/g.7476 Transcript_15446/m.7476 type:complete len:80 (+) Transcript_15446:442-681(+)
MENKFITIPKDKLVIGLANGWADGVKVIAVTPGSAGDAYIRLKKEGNSFRGYMFWCIADEGKKGLYLAKGLNEFLKTRS